MHPPIGDFALPPDEMCFHRRPADEVVPGHGVVLDVTNAALVPGLRRGRLLPLVRARYGAQARGRKPQ